MKKVITAIILFGLIVIVQSIQVIYTTHTFIRVMNLISTIFISVAIGTFIREMFILKKVDK
ncbi:hypothetical protein NSQ95_06930 [Psychrobacillus sp. FSL W7-1457]|uniref:hypothetical protein n=1 Tax=unclassified Psychrobacillus TaxID=2636677 RepID=UPI0030F6224B